MITIPEFANAHLTNHNNIIDKSLYLTIYFYIHFMNLHTHLFKSCLNPECNAYNDFEYAVRAQLRFVQL